MGLAYIVELSYIVIMTVIRLFYANTIVKQLA